MEGKSEKKSSRCGLLRDIVRSDLLVCRPVAYVDDHWLIKNDHIYYEQKHHFTLEAVSKEEGQSGGGEERGEELQGDKLPEEQQPTPYSVIGNAFSQL